MDYTGMDNYLKQGTFDTNMAINELGMNCLHVACSIITENCQMMVFVLIKYGANPNLQDVHGRTPLHFAATAGNSQAMNYLLKKVENLDLNIRTVGGETALFKAVQNLRIDCVSMLLQSGADASIPSYDGESIFDMADMY